MSARRARERRREKAWLARMAADPILFLRAMTPVAPDSWQAVCLRALMQAPKPAAP